MMVAANKFSKPLSASIHASVMGHRSRQKSRSFERRNWDDATSILDDIYAAILRVAAGGSRGDWSALSALEY
jgi:hypothetical protein